MSNELVSAETSSPLTQFLQELNLPQVIAGPAGKAISRLVAGVLEVPVAYMESFAQGIKNKTEARQMVSKEVAAAAARFAAADEDIVARAVHNLLAKEYRHQKSKEDIAKKTIEILQRESAGTGGHAQTQRPLDVDDDWMNVFERHAEEATSERMQRLWAQILAGEIRQPKTFSLKTLRFVAELDQTTAQLFEKYLPRAYGSAIPMRSNLSGGELTDLLHLQEANLISGVGAMLGNNITLDSSGIAMLRNQDHMILLRGDPNASLTHPAAMLTKTGEEIARIVPLPFDIGAARTLVELLPKDTLNSILLGTFVPQGAAFAFYSQEVLWAKDEPKPVAE